MYHDEMLYVAECDSSRIAMFRSKDTNGETSRHILMLLVLFTALTQQLKVKLLLKHCLRQCGCFIIMDSKLLLLFVMELVAIWQLSNSLLLLKEEHLAFLMATLKT